MQSGIGFSWFSGDSTLSGGGQFLVVFALLGLALIFCAFRLYIIQRSRKGGGFGAKFGGDFMPGGFHGLGCGNVGRDACQQVASGQVEGGGSGDDRGIGQAAAVASEEEGGAADSDEPPGGGIAAGESAKVIQNGADGGKHAGGPRLQVVDVNGRASVPVGKPRCYARTIRTRRGHWRVSAESVRACLVACSTAADVRPKASWKDAMTGALLSLLADGRRERGALDAQELIAAGSVAWSPGGGVPAVVVRGVAK